jgi:hypothetical protein
MKYVFILSILVFQLTEIYSQKLKLYDGNSGKILNSVKKGNSIRFVVYSNNPLKLDYKMVDSIVRIDYYDNNHFKKLLLDTIKTPITYLTGEINAIRNDTISLRYLSICDTTNNIIQDDRYFFHNSSLYFKNNFNFKVNVHDIHLLIKEQDKQLAILALSRAAALITGILSPVIAYNFKNKHFNTGKFVAFAGVGFSIYFGGGLVMRHLENNIKCFSSDNDDSKKNSGRYKYAKFIIE